MLLGEKSDQLVMWFGLLVVMVGCNAERFKITDTQQLPVSSASSTNSVAVANQDLVARHQEEDRVWAHRTNLTPKQVRNLRLMSDVRDDEATYIDNLAAPGSALVSALR